MLVTIDKRGSINLPVATRKELSLVPGTCLDLTILAGGKVVLTPVAIYPTVRLSPDGIVKLQDARRSGTDEIPSWLREEMDDAGTDPF